MNYEIVQVKLQMFVPSSTFSMLIGIFGKWVVIFEFYVFVFPAFLWNLLGFLIGST